VVALFAVIIFREANIEELEIYSDYKLRFQIWRGASYVIIFNWVCCMTFYFMEKWGINYRMILMEDDYIVGNPYSFFVTATGITAIYLVLFLMYTLKRLGIIEGHPGIDDLGYIMWLILAVFLFCPFKILNWRSRFYFLMMFRKVLTSPFLPMNSRILFMTFIVGSLVQFYNDFSFTICALRYNDFPTCTSQARLITFVTLCVYFPMRVVQSFRLHSQFFQHLTISPARIRLSSIIFSIITIIASYLYAVYQTVEMLKFWIIIGAFGTLARTHSEMRADWGLFQHNGEECILRKYKTFPDYVYILSSIADVFLDVVWTLTISNNIEAFLKINVLYFFLLLGTIELMRRGLWMVLRVEEEHSRNVAELKALASDQYIITEIEESLKRVSMHHNKIEMELN
jgi:xenotropic and polytropic retrovirus receptor 1